MIPWIKLRTDYFPTDGRLIEVSRLCHADVTAVFGALCALWCLADAQADNEGVMFGYTAEDIDRYVGIPGFTAALPTCWMDLAGPYVKLPNYQQHNGSTAKTRALSQRRQEAHRAQNLSRDLSRSERDTGVTAPCEKALPEEEKEKEEEKKEQAHAVRAPSAPRKKRAVPALAYTPPDGIDRQLWGEFVVMRVRIKHPLTEDTAARIGRKLQRFMRAGQDANECLERAVIREYRDVFPIDRPAANGSGHPPDDDPFKGAI